MAKLYFEEEGSDLVRESISGCEAVFSSVIAYPEMVSALARRKRDGHLRHNDFMKASSAFERDWEEISKVPVNLDLSFSAGQLSRRHFLRGMDAIHLASACFLAKKIKEGIGFLSADREQNQAAAREKLRIEKFFS
ncbi:MAG: type II toxin-antitoxin system VapC family toxin [Elusimicrobia bacterium]|nr:type II toxin-antitoxin system VapC family toxin [Elusimicrobiota bacterium]